MIDWQEHEYEGSIKLKLGKGIRAMRDKHKRHYQQTLTVSYFFVS